MHEQLPTPDKLHHKKYLHLCLEHVLHSNQKRMVSFLQYILLQESRLHLIIIQYSILPQRLHSISLITSLLLHQKNFPKRPLPDNTFDSKIWQFNLVLALRLLKHGVWPYFHHIVVQGRYISVERPRGWYTIEVKRLDWLSRVPRPGLLIENVLIKEPVIFWG